MSQETVGSHNAKGLTKREYFASAALAALLSIEKNPYIQPLDKIAVIAADDLIDALNERD